MQRPRGQAARQIAQISRGQCSRYGSAVRNQYGEMGQDAVIAGQAACQVDRADIVLEQAAEQGEQAAERFWPTRPFTGAARHLEVSPGRIRRCKRVAPE